MCLEKSNQTLYSLSPQEKMELPAVFNRKFTYDNASGYECICVLGTKGRNCEISKLMRINLATIHIPN